MASGAADTPAPSQAQSVKRQRASDSPLLVFSRTSTSISREARSRFFDALGKGDGYPAMCKPIFSADDLTEMQLGPCFDILHACGRATDLDATLETTRQSIDGFLDAVFHDWSSEQAGDLLRPELEFLVEAQVIAGKVCVAPSQHADVPACCSSGIYEMDLSAVATYMSSPAMFKLEFSMVDLFTGQPETVCPLGRSDIRWIAADWQQNLRQTLHSRIVSKLHKYNKHLAIWQARKLIVSWARGGIGMGSDRSEMGFLGPEAATTATMGFGRRGGK